MNTHIAPQQVEVHGGKVGVIDLVTHLAREYVALARKIEPDIGRGLDSTKVVIGRQIQLSRTISLLTGIDTPYVLAQLDRGGLVIQDGVSIDLSDLPHPSSL